MVERVKQWLAEGKMVKIMTARVYFPPRQMFIEADGGFSLQEIAEREEQRQKREDEAHLAGHLISLWCKIHIGQSLPVTCTKDYGMIELWDDRAVRVVLNTGEPCCQL